MGTGNGRKGLRPSIRIEDGNVGRRDDDEAGEFLTE